MTRFHKYRNYHDHMSREHERCVINETYYTQLGFAANTSLKTVHVQKIRFITIHVHKFERIVKNNSRFQK
jgi:hypothetical protein